MHSVTLKTVVTLCVASRTEMDVERPGIQIYESASFL